MAYVIAILERPKSIFRGRYGRRTTSFQQTERFQIILGSDFESSEPEVKSMSIPLVVPLDVTLQI